MTYIFIILWFAYWSAESGASLPWSSKWQDVKPWYSEAPEGIIALTIGLISLWGWSELFNIDALAALGGFILAVVISYIGKQSATWAMLEWTGHTKTKDNDRKSTLRPFNDWVGKLLGYRLGHEGYSWVWAATKGFIITLPVAGLGLIFHPLGHELGSHAKGRLGGDPNMWKELCGGAGIGVSCALFIFIIGVLL